MTRRFLRFLAPVWVTLGIVVTGLLVAIILNWFIARPRQTAGMAPTGLGAAFSAPRRAADLLVSSLPLLGASTKPDWPAPSVAPGTVSAVSDPSWNDAVLTQGSVGAPTSQAGEEARPATAPTGVGNPSPIPAARLSPRATAGSCDSPCSVVLPTPGPTWGVASWYSDHGRAGFYAALPHWDGRPVEAVVCTFPDGRSNCLTVLVADSCQCYVGTAWEKAIDLSPAAFAQFAPLSAGIVKVLVQVLR